MIFRFDESVFGEKCKQKVKNDDEQHKINRTRDQSGLTQNEGIGKKDISIDFDSIAMFLVVTSSEKVLPR